jgi:predicted PurR-regulated permease PerM
MYKKGKTMTGIRADRIFFYLTLLLVSIITLILIWPYLGSVVLAIIVAVVLHPAHGWFIRRTGGRTGLATALTLLSTLLLVVIPVLVGTWLLLDAFVVLSADVADIMQKQEAVWLHQVRQVDNWLSSTELAGRSQLEPGEITQSIRELAADMGRSLVNWLASVGISAASLILPTIIFISLLGTLLTNSGRTVQLIKDLSPLDDSIDQIFLDRMRIMTRAMMLSIVVAAIVQGLVTGLLMAIGGTPHIVPLTLLAIILSILPGGAAIIAVPVGLAHLLAGNMWAGLLIIVGSVTFVAALQHQVRPAVLGMTHLWGGCCNTSSIMAIPKYPR